MTHMVHPELPGQDISVDPRAVEIHRRSGWLTLDDIPVPCGAPNCHVQLAAPAGFDLTRVRCSAHADPATD